jgi:hypothetical protein
LAATTTLAAALATAATLAATTTLAVALAAALSRALITTATWVGATTLPATGPA